MAVSLNYFHSDFVTIKDYTNLSVSFPKKFGFQKSPLLLSPESRRYSSLLFILIRCPAFDLNQTMLMLIKYEKFSMDVSGARISINVLYEPILASQYQFRKKILSLIPARVCCKNKPRLTTCNCHVLISTHGQHFCIHFVKLGLARVAYLYLFLSKACPLKSVYI